MKTPDGDRADRDERSRFLEAYLATAPLGVALWRAGEAVALSGVELTPPVLDVGCGFGEFGRIFFQGRPLPDLGLDIVRSELRRSAQDRVYKSVIQADARRLPLADRSIGSALSVSTLEHIPDVQQALAEIARVLKPGAVLAFTVPTRSFSENLLGQRLLATARLAGAAGAYAGAINRGLTHVNVWPEDEWLAMTANAGLDVVSRVRTLPPRATVAFEALLPSAFASRLWRQAFGKRPPHPRALMRLFQRLFTPMVKPGDAGSNLAVVARRRP